MKRVLRGSELLEDFEPGIIAARLNGEEPAARSEAASERPENLLCFELGGYPRAPGLRCQNQVVAR